MIPLGKSLAAVGLSSGLISMPWFMPIGFAIAALSAGFLALQCLPLGLGNRFARNMALGGVALGMFCLSLGVFGTSSIGSGHGRSDKALMAATSLELALLSYDMEYGMFPKAPDMVQTHSPAALPLLRTLLGLGGAEDRNNPRGIKFLSVREGKGNRNGLIHGQDDDSVTGLFDPWGAPYTVVLDHAKTGNLHFKVGGKSVNLKDRHVAVFSPGADGKYGTKDDIETW